jgi:hypothetical protein
MPRLRINPLSDWQVWVLLALPALILFQLTLQELLGVRSSRNHIPITPEFLGFLGVLSAVCVSVAVMRLRTIRRVNERGVVVEAEVYSTFSGLFGANKTHPSIIYVKYTFGGRKLTARLDGLGGAGGVTKGGRVWLLIDPAKPSRCFITDEPVT